MTESVNFDQVKVGDDRLSVEHFLALPFVERVEHILSGNLEFFSNGQPVEPREALDSLRVRNGSAS